MTQIISGHVRFHESLEPLLDDITKLRPHEENSNNGDIDAICRSIEQFGYIMPIAVEKETGRIIAGNHRYHALLSMGAKVAPVIWVEMSQLEGKGYMLADNRTGQLAVQDNSQLLALLHEIAEADPVMMEATAYNQMDITLLEALEQSRLENADFSSWPTLSLRIPPHLKNAFYEMTEHATADHERLEALLRMAGWKGERLYNEIEDE